MTVTLSLERIFSGEGFGFNELWAQATCRPDDGVLQAFYPPYDASFVLKDEKEDIRGFESCLALNFGAPHIALINRYGPFREIVLVVRQNSTGPVIGGANFLVATGHQDSPAAFTVNLNYLFVVPKLRGKGFSRKLLATCDLVASAVAVGWIPRHSSGRGLRFLEINDPFRLSDEQYMNDTVHSGIDQIDRLAYWGCLGASLIAINYVQPALSADQSNDNSLAMAVMPNGLLTLPTTSYRAHLERFFGISVLKGAPINANAAASIQLRELKNLELTQPTLALYPLDGVSTRLRELRQLPGGIRPQSLLDALVLLKRRT